MKLNRVLTLIALSVLLFLGLSSLSVSASSWKRGVPDSINSPITKPWVSNKKGGTGTDSKGKKFYSVDVLITNNQIGGAQRYYYLNGKPDNSIPANWAQAFSNPYYKKTGSTTYIIKNKVAAKMGLQRVKVQKIGNKIKVWYKLKTGKYFYNGLYTKTNLDIYAKENSD